MMFPIEAVAIPLPTPLITPPTTKIYFGFMCFFQENRGEKFTPIMIIKNSLLFVLFLFFWHQNNFYICFQAVFQLNLNFVLPDFLDRRSEEHTSELQSRLPL